MLDKSVQTMYYIKAVCGQEQNMEQYRSGHNGHDWKSCVPQKGTEGSNPSCSARSKQSFLIERLFLFYSENVIPIWEPCFFK